MWQPQVEEGSQFVLARRWQTCYRSHHFSHVHSASLLRSATTSKWMGCETCSRDSMWLSRVGWAGLGGQAKALPIHRKG